MDILVETRMWVRVVFALAYIPIAVAANSLRIVGAGVLVGGKAEAAQP
jgi:hypothetical protein